MAWALFEKLVHKCFVTKNTRKVTLAVCILLVYKFTTPQTPSNQHHQLAEVVAKLKKLERNGGDLFKKPLIKLEMQVYAQLNFSLHVFYEHFAPHFLSFLNMLDLSLQEYLSPEELQAIALAKPASKIKTPPALEAP